MLQYSLFSSLQVHYTTTLFGDKSGPHMLVHDRRVITKGEAMNRTVYHLIDIPQSDHSAQVCASNQYLDNLGSLCIPQYYQRLS